jgi:hypothetical protein
MAQQLKIQRRYFNFSNSKIYLNLCQKKVRIPTPLRKLTNNEELVEVNAATIGEAIRHLTGSSL